MTVFVIILELHQGASCLAPVPISPPLEYWNYTAEPTTGGLRALLV